MADLHSDNLTIQWYAFQEKIIYIKNTLWTFPGKHAYRKLIQGKWGAFILYSSYTLTVLKASSYLHTHPHLLATAVQSASLLTRIHSEGIRAVRVSVSGPRQLNFEMDSGRAGD